MTIIGNTIFFRASDDVNGTELWKTDGTEAGTVLIKDIYQGPNSSYPGSLIANNGLLYFTATTSNYGSELYVSDGTVDGTKMIKDIIPGNGGSFPNNLTVVGNLVFFYANDGELTSMGSLATKLGKTDGTEAGTVFINPNWIKEGAFDNFYAFGNKLLFGHNGPINGYPITATGKEPWISDGTDAGTTLLKDINTTTPSSTPTDLHNAGSAVFFRATDATNGTELWKTDGTEAGTVLVKNILSGLTSSTPTLFATVNGITFFTAASPTTSDRELWKTDGTEAGTERVKDIRPGTTGSNPSLLTPVGNTLFFIANDGTSGLELWKSDGTEAGTVMVVELSPGAASPNIQSMVNVDGTLFFTASINGKVELMKSDGTEAGTVIVKDLRPGAVSAYPSELVAYNGKLYFAANDGINGNELWVSDGTELGTFMLGDLNSGTGNSNPADFKVTGGKLYFRCFLYAYQFEPWVTDGTPAGTFMIADVYPGGSGSVPSGFEEMNGYVYFSASSPGLGYELWRTDGTSVGTTLVKDINPGSAGSNPEQLTAIGNTLFFRATNADGGQELFQSDGTEAGTFSYDLYPGATGSVPDFLTSFNGALLFAATDLIKGRELWKAETQELPSSSYNIIGDTIVCVGKKGNYAATNVIDNHVTYNWSLPDGGGTLVSTDSTATVTWASAGDYRVSLSLSNSAGTTAEKQITVHVITGGTAPVQAPIIIAFGRTLTATNIPAGVYCRWYRNGVEIDGANEISYYAAQAGTYTARFVNICEAGPISNAITFNNDVIAQTIAFNAIPDIQLEPDLKIKLNATTTSGLPVFFQKISGPGNIINDTLYVSGAGTLIGEILIKATQPGNDTYSPAPDVLRTVRILKGNQTITFDSIPDMIFNDPDYTLRAVATTGLNVSFSITAGNNSASIVAGNKIKLTGAGTITVRASQLGNINYLPAPNVERTFCVGVRALGEITGDPNPCLNTYRYTVQKIPGAIYTWSLDGGGTLSSNFDTAWVQWQNTGTHTLSVKANTACDTEFTNVRTFETTTSNNAPNPVTSMTPANTAVDQQLPLRLSWIPGTNSTLYDIYVWKSTDPEPTTPYAVNIDNISFTLPMNSFPYNDTYKWRVVSKNPCSQTAGPIQEFSIIPLPDLVVSDVQAPIAAVSGQTVTISWKVTNAGPGATLPTSTWNDVVFFTLDTVPFVDFTGSAFWNPNSWGAITGLGKPLIVGSKERPVQLAVGESYTNSVDFTLPMNYDFPVYAYVITNYGANENNRVLQETNINDTARTAGKMVITLPPLPDLRVDSVFVTNATFSGSTVDITYKVKNYGAQTPPNGVWVDSLFISQDPLFNSNTAIPLHSPKLNDTYYPNAKKLGVVNNTQLEAGDFYTKTVSAVIPNFIFGTWFIYVKTNARSSGNYIYEGPLSNNNLGQKQLEVYLSPTPKLTVNSISSVPSSLSTTQTINLNWNIKNEGFYDNKERNKGHILKLGTCTLPPYNRVENAVLQDSVVFGSSYWIDRVYLSTDPLVLNPSSAILLAQVDHGTANSGEHADAPGDSTYVRCPSSISTSTININNVIKPGEDYPKSREVNIPSDLPTGNYYIYVYTNPTKTVFEYPGTPQIKRSAVIQIKRPDVVVSSITAPSAAIGGTTISVNYAVLNNGPGTVFNYIRRDKFYISSSPVFDGTAELIGVSEYFESLPVAVPVLHNFEYTIPSATSGMRYFFVHTNFDEAFKETDITNNISSAAVTMVTSATPADLYVSNVNVSLPAFTSLPQKITYTVTNGGFGETSGTWVDSVFISCNSTFNRSNSYFIGAKTQSRSIAFLNSYTDSLIISMDYAFQYNSCFPVSEINNAYFYVKTNANNGTYEGVAVGNNVGSSNLTMITNPLVDHIVPIVTGPDEANVGASYTVDWAVKNIGYNPNRNIYYNYWSDGIYFSTDSFPDVGDLLVSSQGRYLQLERDEALDFSKSFRVPYMPGGEYYVYVKTNNTLSISGEFNTANNVNFIRDANGKAKKIQVISLAPAALSDLVVSIESIPENTPIGQPVTVIYKVTNNGPGTTYPRTRMPNKVWLSADFIPSADDFLIGLRNIDISLDAGQYYYDTVTAVIPESMTPGNYVIISKVNYNNTIIETNSENNLGMSIIKLFMPPPSDLVVEKVIVPDTLTLGYTIDTAKWVISNLSDVEAKGFTKDAIYLSTADVLDSTAILLGIKDKQILMQPLQTDTVRMVPLVTGVIEGEYNVFVKADVLFNIPESDEDNNVGKALEKVYVKVKALPLDTDEPNTLQDIGRYYKLEVPDSLIGSTIRVTLTTSHPTTMNNELFIGGGYVPTAAHHDYGFEIPNSGNQQIIMAEVDKPVYYIYYRCANPNPVVQNVVLKAVIMPFAITNVDAGSGGNIGNVTIRIRGSLFVPNMTAVLSNGTTTITASAVYFTNSTQVFATFNLQGKPLGIYDVKLVKPDADEAVLLNGFSIVPADNGGLITGGGVNTGPGNGDEPGCDPGAASGLNSQLLVELIVPGSSLMNRPVTLLIHYSNPTNVDLPGPTRILYNSVGMKMAFTREGIPTGTNSLYIEFTEPGGPPGIIRAGASGTITVYSTSPNFVPAGGYAIFNLQ